MSNRAQLSETLNRLLPGEQWKRVREGILAAASYSGQRTDQLRQNIDEANRLKTGLLVNGTVEFTSTTNADLSGYAWVIDYEIQQQTATESVTVDAPDADFPRPDILVGLADGSIDYRAGTIDEEGNVQDPSYNPATEVLLAAVTRNPDTSNEVSDESASPSDFVSKSATGTEIMQGSLAIGSLSDPDNPSNLIQVDTNGKIIIVRADRYGSFATRNLAVGFSRLARINTVVSGGPAIRDYQFKLDILSTLDGDITQRGELYCALINDGTGTYVSSVLEVTGDLNPAVFKLVKVSATAYDLFYEHLDTKAILIYRPFALGPADRYIFYRRETILASLPAGDQYSFSEAGGGTSLDADIVDALEASLTDSPSSSNRYVTVNLLNSYAYVQDAPTDGGHYARKDGSWVSFTPFAVAGTPTDGHVVTSVAGVPTWAAPSGGGGGLWTDATTHIYRDSRVVIGETGLPTDATFSVRSKSPINNSEEFFQAFTSNGLKSVVFKNDASSLFESGFASSYLSGGYDSNNYGILVNSKSGSSSSRYIFKVRSDIRGDIFTIYANDSIDVKTPNFRVGLPTIDLATHGVTFKSTANNNDSFTGLVLQSNNSGGRWYVRFAVGGRYEFRDRRMWVGDPSSPTAFGSHFKGTANASSANPIFQIDNSVNDIVFQVRGNRQVLMPGLPIVDPLVAGSLWNDSGTVKISAG